MKCVFSSIKKPQKLCQITLMLSLLQNNWEKNSVKSQIWFDRKIMSNHSDACFLPQINETLQNLCEIKAICVFMWKQFGLTEKNLSKIMWNQCNVVFCIQLTE